VARRKIKQTEKTKRKDDLDPAKDEFVTKTISILDWAYERRRPIALVLGLALLAAIVGIIVDSIMKKSANEASAALSQGLEAALAPVIPLASEDAQTPSNADDDRLSFENREARATETLKRFEKVASTGKSDVGLIADLVKAAAHLDLNETDKAAALYEKILKSKDTPSWLIPIATEGLGLALEKKGDIDGACAKYDELISKSKGVGENLARYNAARIAQKKGEKEKAAELFKAIIDSYDERDYSRLNFFFAQARERLLEMDPEADVPPLPAGGMGGLEGIDPELLQQLLQAQAGGGAS
jgi:tetratricopeptide (TPR) repeat protein